MRTIWEATRHGCRQKFYGHPNGRRAEKEVTNSYKPIEVTLNTAVVWLQCVPKRLTFWELGLECSSVEVKEPLKWGTQWEVVLLPGAVPSEEAKKELLRPLVGFCGASCYKSVSLTPEGPGFLSPHVSSAQISTIVTPLPWGLHQRPNQWGHLVLEFWPPKLWAKQISFLCRVPSRSQALLWTASISL